MGSKVSEEGEGIKFPSTITGSKKKFSETDESRTSSKKFLFKTLEANK